MKSLLFALLLSISINASAAVDVCKHGPRAISSFVKARDSGTSYEIVRDSIESAPGQQTEIKDFYLDMAGWVYQHPDWSADYLIDTLFQTCFVRTPPPGLSIP
ncbi:hypothetical protein AB4Y43_01430 [Paraburkholderia sp. BR10872]|uniref:hypothetical protein n=1 Tax=Paraburkholderia sp. BR10872 TaxID=3236989 RepID=UPI0034D31068